MKIFCDMDGVIVNQTGRIAFDLMPWMSDGKKLWQFIAPLNPIILSWAWGGDADRIIKEKHVWLNRELGVDVPRFLLPDSVPKYTCCEAGAVLVDDSDKHKQGWENAGGVFIHHSSADSTIKLLGSILI